MTIRQRAIAPIDKLERHDAILAAAERLLVDHPGRMPNVADVAAEAGLAKGTVYLYFPSKDELLLAVHEREVDGFFRALSERLEAPEAVGADDLLELTFTHIVDPPLFLPLASRCFTLMAQAIPPVTAAEFHQRMGERLLRAGHGLERHFPDLGPGEGIAMLRHSFALITGLWQMSVASGCSDGVSATAVTGRSDSDQPGLVWNYRDELGRALRGLWARVAR